MSKNGEWRKAKSPFLPPLVKGDRGGFGGKRAIKNASMKVLFLFLSLFFAVPIWALEIKLQWADNSTNEDGFVIERRLDADAWAEIGKTAANVTTFSDLAPVAGKKHSYRVLAFNAGGKSGSSNEAIVTYFVAYPITLQATAPESGVIALTLALPKTATESKLQITAGPTMTQADATSVASLYINGNGPLDLFRAASGFPNTGKDVSFTLPVPVAYWRDGENRLLFVHEKDPGYMIKAAEVIFTLPLLAPSGLAIAVP